jgi:hypothetical protein
VAGDAVKRFAGDNAMSHLRDAEKSRFEERRKAFLLGLYVGLSLILLVACMDKQHDDALHVATNIYGLQALAGAALGFWRVKKWADKPWTTPAVASVWLCVGLALWAVGQVVWTWAAWMMLDLPDKKPPVPYAEASDIFYIASDVVWLVALLKIFQSLGRRGLTEISPFVPIMIPALMLLVGAFAWIDKGLIEHSESPTNTLTLVCDLVYILLTFASTFLAAALLMGQNAEIPLPVHQCLRWLCAGAAINALAILAFTVMEKYKEPNMLAYFNGNWADWLFLTAMYCWGVAALKWPVRQEELEYTLGTTRNSMSEADVYQAGEIARSCCEDKDKEKQAENVERVTRYVHSIRWVLDTVPGCWRVVKLGDMVVGSTFLFPVPRRIMEAFHKDELGEQELFERIKKSPLEWDYIYLADASILARHRRRGLAFKAFKTTIENIAEEHPQVEVYCWPTSTARKKLVEKLQKHLKDQQVKVKKKD